jgi:hypothetical protein
MAVIAALALGGGCARGAIEAPTGGRNSVGQIDRYLEKAVGLSNEGVVLMPSDSMARETERTRLNEIAQALRIPFAACFLRKTIEVSKVALIEDNLGLVAVPQGQVRLRARLNGSGKVLRAELMESTIEDDAMIECVQEAVVAQEFPRVRSSTLRWVDVVYWVSLGYDRGRDSPERKVFNRRQVADASRAAKPCLSGRVQRGEYALRGVSLVDREGSSLINRIEPNDLPPPVNRCIAQVFRQIQAPPDPEAFVRAVIADMVFVVGADGAVGYEDEEWLRLTDLEAAAIRRERRAEEQSPAGGPRPSGAKVIISGVGVSPAPARGFDPAVEGPRLEGAPNPFGSNARDSRDEVEGTPQNGESQTGGDGADGADPGEDPATSGLRLKLGGRSPAQAPSKD